MRTTVKEFTGEGSLVPEKVTQLDGFLAVSSAHGDTLQSRKCSLPSDTHHFLQVSRYQMIR